MIVVIEEGLTVTADLMFRLAERVEDMVVKNIVARLREEASNETSSLSEAEIINRMGDLILDNDWRSNEYRRVTR